MIAGSSSPSSASSAQPVTQPDTTSRDLLDCGHRSTDRFWRCVRRKEQPVAKIERVCPSCAHESSEDTTGASGRRASDAASRVATTEPSTLRQELAVLTNSCRARGSTPSIAPRLLDGRAHSSLPEPFKTLLHGVFSNATDWVLGLRAAVVGRRER